MNAEERFWARLVDRLPEDRLADISIAEADRRLAAAGSSELAPEAVESILAGMRSRRLAAHRRSWRRGLVAATLLLGIGLLISAGVTTMAWPSGQKPHEWISLPGAIELMFDDGETFDRREQAMIRVFYFGCAGARELRRYADSHDPVLGPPAVRALGILEQVLGGSHSVVEADLSCDFRLSVMTARDVANEARVRRESLERVAAHAAIAIEALRNARSVVQRLAPDVTERLSRIRRHWVGGG